jgi:hypothetical protein
MQLWSPTDPYVSDQDSPPIGSSWDSRSPLLLATTEREWYPADTTRSEESPSIITSEKRRRNLSQPHSVTLIARAAIVGGWLVAVFIALAQHSFLSSLDGKDIHDETFMGLPIQFWIKTGATAFVRGVILSLTMSAGYVLAQMVRFYPDEWLIRVHIYPSILRFGVFLQKVPFACPNLIISSNYRRSLQFHLSSSPPYYPLSYRLYYLCFPSRH